MQTYYRINKLTLKDKVTGKIYYFNDLEFISFSDRFEVLALVDKLL